MKNLFEILNIAEEDKKYFYWFFLALSTFIIINIIFDPFRILNKFGMGILPLILTFLTSIYFGMYTYMKILSIIFFLPLFYVFYRISRRKIHKIYFLLFFSFIFIALSPLLITIYFIYLCRNGGDMGCFLIFATIPIIIISSLIAYFFYYKSEGLK